MHHLDTRHKYTPEHQQPKHQQHSRSSQTSFLQRSIRSRLHRFTGRDRRRYESTLQYARGLLLSHREGG
ncbi:hypothetical protein P692DRAFT_201003792 [Suillus brevipes Sb2]|nr:hypothetical protein P692DRAFT_201003792 [Suillus brevipes Sb2]